MIIVVLFLQNLVFQVNTESIQNETSFLNDYGQYADNRMRAIGEYFSELMGCGAEGWCAFRCCPTERQFARGNGNNQRLFPNPAAFKPRNQQTGSSRGMRRYPYVNRNPAVRTTTLAPTIKLCANACMPQCNTRCLERYNQIVASFMNSLTAIDVMGQPVSEGVRGKNIRFSPKKEVECRDECMPYCTPQCLDAYSLVDINSQPKVCKSVCMPECAEECVTAPPLMVPCVFDNVCHCPAGYVRCSEMTCCMKYKTMAVRYRNRMTSMSFSDDEETDPLKTTGNETSVYMSELRKMGGTPTIKSTTVSMRTLPSNSTIVYYPEQGKAEILKNDGSVVVEVMEEASQGLKRKTETLTEEEDLE